MRPPRLLGGGRPRPALSVVVVIHRMPTQAERTLRSLALQDGVEPGEVEVIVAENASDAVLGEARARAALPGARYLLREEPRPSPVPAVNHAASLARGRALAVAVDGARLLSPGVLRLTLAALRAFPGAAVAVPGYHLGPEPQQDSVNKGHDEAADAALLQGIGWPADGYRLFEVAVWSRSSRRGFLRPLSESNFLAMGRAKWEALGGMDRRYDSMGGGKANLDLYKRLLELPETPLVLLHGEGTFHQVHGGISTNTRAGEREAVMSAIQAQDRAIRGEARPPDARPILFGPLHPAARPFLALSLERAG